MAAEVMGGPPGGIERDYPEPVVSWLSAGRVRFVLILLAVAPSTS